MIKIQEKIENHRGETSYDQKAYKCIVFNTSMDGLNNNVWIGKKVYLVLKSNRRYSGIVKDFNSNFIILKDKYDENVMASISEISSLEEEE
jgi:small nuclear ribonucleoprotein (snRNP)-like protein